MRADEAPINSKTRTIQVQHIGDTQFSVSIRDHGMIVDQPRAAGGKDEGPTPTELLIASLATCVAFFGRGFLHSRGLPDRVNVYATWYMELSPMRVTQVQLRVEAPGITPEDMQALQRTLEHCTVQNVFDDPPLVELEVTTRETFAT